MKKIYYLLAFATVAITLASCDPLSQTYKQMDAVVAQTPQTLPITLTTSYASPSLAVTGILATLNSTYAKSPDGTNAAVTYVATASSTAFAPVVTLSQVAYTMVAADYTFPGNTFSDLTDAGVLNFLAYKYPTPVANQQVVLTYNYFLSGYTSSSGTITTDTFVFAGGVWVKAYTVTPTQYASVGRGLTNTFVSADLTNVPAYLGGFLKADPSVTLNAKAGDVKYVSYRYATTSNYILPMYYNGTTWNSTPTLNFTKLNGTWQQVQIITINITLKDPVADPIIAKAGFGTATQVSDLTTYGDFDSSWATSDLDGAFIAVLKVEVPTPKQGYNYNVVFLKYVSGDVSTTLSFQWNGTAWVALQ